MSKKYWSEARGVTRGHYGIYYTGQNRGRIGIYYIYIKEKITIRRALNDRSHSLFNVLIYYWRVRNWTEAPREASRGAIMASTILARIKIALKYTVFKNKYTNTQILKNPQ